MKEELLNSIIPYIAPKLNVCFGENSKELCFLIEAICKEGENGFEFKDIDYYRFELWMSKICEYVEVKMLQHNPRVSCLQIEGCKRYYKSLQASLIAKSS